MGISNFSTSGLKPGVCTSTTRPSAPYEGMMIYETDTDMVALWNGSAWRYIAASTPTNGTVLQVVSATTSTELSSSTQSYADTGLSASITPKSSSSKVLVIVNQNGVYKSGAFVSNGVQLKLFRNSTEINFFGFVVCYTGTSIENYGAASVNHLDSPNTTSSVTYKTQFANWQNQASVKVQAGSATSTITLMEIAG